MPVSSSIRKTVDEMRTILFGNLSTFHTPTLKSRAVAAYMGLVFPDERTLDNSSTRGGFTKRHFGNDVGFTDNCTTPGTDLLAIILNDMRGWTARVRACSGLGVSGWLCGLRPCNWLGAPDGRSTGGFQTGQAANRRFGASRGNGRTHPRSRRHGATASGANIKR